MVVFHHYYLSLLLFWIVVFCIHGTVAQDDGAARNANMAPVDSSPTGTDFPAPAAAATGVVILAIFGLVSFCVWRRRRHRLSSSSSTGRQRGCPRSDVTESVPFGQDESTFGSNATTHVDEDEKKWHQRGPPPVPLPTVDISLPMPPQSTYLFADKLELGTGDESLFLKFLQSEEQYNNSSANSNNKRTNMATSLRNTLRQSLRLTNSNKDSAKRVALRDIAFDGTSAPSSPPPPRRSVSMKKKVDARPQPDIKVGCSAIISEPSSSPSVVEKPTSVPLTTVTAPAKQSIATTEPPPRTGCPVHPDPDKDQRRNEQSAERAAHQLIQFASVQTKHRADERMSTVDIVKAATITDAVTPLSPRAFESAPVGANYEAQKPPETTGTVSRTLAEAITSAPHMASSSMSARRRPSKASEKKNIMTIFGGKEKDQEEAGDKMDRSGIASKCQLNDNYNLPPAAPIQKQKAEEFSLDDGSGQRRDDPLLLQQGPNQRDALAPPEAPPITTMDLPRTGSVQDIISWWQKESSLRNRSSEQSLTPSSSPSVVAIDHPGFPEEPPPSPTSSLLANAPPSSTPLGSSCAPTSTGLGSLSRTSAAERVKILANNSSSSSSSSSRHGARPIRRPLSQQHLQSSPYSNNDNNNGGNLVSFSKRAQVRTVPDEPSSLQDAPMPTASFSSSTVNTMIPADDYLGRNNPLQQRQKQVQPKSSQQAIKLEHSENVQDGKMQQAESIPCRTQGNMQQQSSSDGDKKTPAQQERDRYLKSLE